MRRAGGWRRRRALARAGAATRVREVVRRRVERLGDDACAVLEVGARRRPLHDRRPRARRRARRAAVAAALDRGAAGRLVAPRPTPGQLRVRARDRPRRRPRRAARSAARARSTRRSPPLLRRRRAPARDVPAAQIAHHALAAARARRRPAAGVGAGAARPRARPRPRSATPRPRRTTPRRSRRSRWAPRHPPAERRATLLALADATFAAGRHRGRPPALLAGRCRRAPRRRRGGARPRGARVRAGAAPTAPSTARAIALLTQALERLRPDGALRARVTGAAGGPRARPGAARGADRRGARDGPPARRRGHARRGCIRRR